MRLIARSTADGSRLGVLVGDGLAIDVADLDPSLPATMTALIDGGVDAVIRIGSALDRAPGSITGRPLDELALEAPVGRVGKIVAIGKNYREHAAEEGGVGSLRNRCRVLPDRPHA